MNTTPDLTNEYNPMPKPHKKVKMPTAMKTVGKKTVDWVDARAILKTRFFVAHIVECEIKIKKVCWKNNALSFCHLDKRRRLTVEDLLKVVLGCIPCHTIVEAMPVEEMRKLLQGIIDKRSVQP